MATPTLKHGAHRIAMNLGAIAATSANDVGELFTYDFNYSAYAVYDPTTEYIVRATLVFDATAAAVATNNFSIQMNQYSSAGVLKNQVVYGNAAAGIATTAFAPIDMTGPPAGNLTNPTGVPVQNGWALVPGDSIEIRRVSNGTGQASPAFTVTFAIGVPS